MCRVTLIAAMILCALAGSATAQQDLGPLDQPLTSSGTEKPGKSGVSTLLNQPSLIRATDPATAQKQLRKAVAKEQKALEKLNRKQLQKRADAGERGALIALGTDFAKEATLLSFAPMAANDALSDAARMYSLAASRGFPGAPSLDQAGVQFYPIRAHRELRR